MLAIASKSKSRPPMSWAMREKARAATKAQWQDPAFRGIWLSQADIQAIRTALDNGARPVDVANDYLVTVARIYQLRKRAA